MFLGNQPVGSPGVADIANAIRRPSAVIAPDGAGFLAHVAFRGSGAEAIQVTDIVLLDHQKHLNQRPATIAVRDEAVELRPYLYPGAPSPFQSQTFLQFRVPGRQRVELKVYDVAGRRVRTLVDGEIAAGIHRVAWNATTDEELRVASGVYFARFSTSGYHRGRRIVLIR